MKIIHFDEFVFEKESEKHKYYRLVLRTEGGYIVKKLTPKCYVWLCENSDHYMGLTISELLYDEYCRVADILE